MECWALGKPTDDFAEQGKEEPISTEEATTVTNPSTEAMASCQ